MIRITVMLAVSIGLIVSASVSAANEASLQEAYGSIGMMEGEHETIRFDSEVVTIELHKDHYTVDAVFELFNEGEETTVQVGFPDFGYGHSGVFKGVQPLGGFETWVNGEQCDFRNRTGTLDIRVWDRSGQNDLKYTDSTVIAGNLKKLRDGETSFEGHKGSTFVQETRWYVKDVVFKGHATTTTRVRYSAPYAGFGNVEYLYGTGRSWKGNIGTSRFVVKSSPERWVIYPGRFCKGGAFRNSRDFEMNRLNNYEHEYVLEDFEPESDENIRIFTSDRWQPWLMEGQFKYDVGPRFGNVELTDNELNIMTKWHIEMLRKMFYRRRGKGYSELGLEEFFHKQGIRYYVQDDFSEDDLTDQDKKYIALIDKYLQENEALLNR